MEINLEEKFILLNQEFKYLQIKICIKNVGRLYNTDSEYSVLYYIETKKNSD